MFTFPSTTTGSRLIFLLQALLVASLLITSTQGKEFIIPKFGRAEGLTHVKGNDFLVTNFYGGDVFLFNTYTGLITTAVHAPKGRIALGTFTDGNYIYVAGANFPPSLNVYSLSLGTEIKQCLVDGKMINDVVANDEFAYFTDSEMPYIFKLHLKALPNDCVVEKITLPVDSFCCGGTRGNGIVLYNEGIIIVNSVDRTLYFIDLLNGNHMVPLLPLGTLPHCDGLDLVQDRSGRWILFVAQGDAGLISIWVVTHKDRTVSLSKLQDVKSPKMHSPTAIAAQGSCFAVANFDFRIPYFPQSAHNFTVLSICLKNMHVSHEPIVSAHMQSDRMMLPNYPSDMF